MKKQEFIRDLSEYCEFENNSFTENTLLESIEGYDSLAVMSIIAFVDENFQVQMNSEQLGQIKDFGFLIDFIGRDNFND